MARSHYVTSYGLVKSADDENGKVAYKSPRDHNF